MPKTPTAIRMKGTVKLDCPAGGPSPAKEVGIHQVETSEVNNAHYLGAGPGDGSLWVRLDSPSVRPKGPCPDSPYGKFWNQSAGATCGATSTVEFQDWPQDSYKTILDNPMTGKPNYLAELHTHFEFTTFLMVRRPNDSLETLRWLRWSVGWDYLFDTPASGESKVKKGSLTSSSTATFVDPEPPPSEAPTHYAVPAKNCNTLGLEASEKPASVEASK